MPFLAKLRNKHPDKRHRRVEAHNISKLCEKYPAKYRSPADVYFGEIECVFDIWTDIVIDFTVLRVEGEVEQEDFDKRQQEREAKQTQPTTYQNPLHNRQHDAVDEDAW